MNVLKKIITIFIILSCFKLFFFVNKFNYNFIDNNKYKIINEPSLFPNKNIIKYTSFWFENLIANLYWLRSIQYVWSNVRWWYRKYLYHMFDLITDLNPYFVNPYITWILLIPEDNNFEENNENNLEAEKIWLKWIKNFCNSKLIEEIKKIGDFEKLWGNPKYKNPCLEPSIAFHLWYLYYYYLKDSKNSAMYYTISSLVDWSLLWAKTLAWVMTSKSWDREKSIKLFLQLAKNSDEQHCIDFGNIILANFEKNNITSDFLKQAQSIKEEIDNVKSYNISESLNCMNYINKGLREINIYYFDNANKKYFEKYNKYALKPEELKEKWYINYIPIDYQQEENYWMIYYYNPEINWFDNKWIAF